MVRLKDQTIKNARIMNVADIGDEPTKFCSVKSKSRPPARRRAGCFRWASCGRTNRRRRSLPTRAGPRAAWPHDRPSDRRLCAARFRSPRRRRACRRQRSRSGDGVIQFRPTETGRVKLANAPETDVHWLAAEQSNSSLTIGDTAMLKIFRRISPGQHPEAEMNRYLTAQGFIHAPSILGDVVRVAPDGTPSTLRSRSNSSATRATPGLGSGPPQPGARCPSHRPPPRIPGRTCSPIAMPSRRHRPAPGRDACDIGARHI